MSVTVPKSCKVYTPPDLAAAIVARLKNEADDTWLEPCFGKGSFLEALSKIGVPPSRIVAVDLDRRASPADRLANSHRGMEFLEWSLSCRTRFTKIVANPPFVSFRRLPERLQSIAERLDCGWAGHSGGNSNLWFAFLRASLSLLKPGGTIGFIVPAAFEYAHYASRLRSRIHKHFEDFEVHRCSEPLFDDVRDGCVILIGRGYKHPHVAHMRFEYRSAKNLIHELGSHAMRHPPIAKASAHRLRAIRFTTKLKTVLEIKIGCVTGDAQYFLLRESERLRLRLPVRSLRPILTRARHVEAAAATKGYWQHLRKNDERVWLFRPRGSYKNVPAVARYLRLSTERGGCNRQNYKVKKRSVWYQVDVPMKIDGFISGTSRLGPFISFNRYRSLLANNTLYCVEFKKALTNDERAALALAFLSRDFRREYVAKLRTYPDGLKKIEPGDLAKMRILRPPEDCSGAYRQYKKAIRVLVESGRSRAERIASEWFGSKRINSFK
jgi:adenine-specific DNA-methyltransferase